MVSDPADKDLITDVLQLLRFIRSNSGNGEVKIIVHLEREPVLVLGMTATRRSKRAVAM